MSNNTNALKVAAAGQAAKKTDFPAMLEKFKGEIARALPKHLSPDRMARIALTAFRQTPKLAECDPRSVFAAVIQSSQLGLEVGLMGEAYLVPYKTTCQLIPGYQGLMKLARNTGQITDIYAHAVRANDTFDISLGLGQNLIHEPLKRGGFPASEEERGEIAGFYAVAVLKDGSRTFQAMSREQVDSIRDGSIGYQSAKRFKKDSPWETNFEEMGLKTVIRRLCKYLPKSPELSTAMAMDESADKGQQQNININDAIDGTWAPVPEDATTQRHSADQDTVEKNEPVVTPQEPVKALSSGQTDQPGSWIPTPEEMAEIAARERAEAADDQPRDTRRVRGGFEME